ncbi:MAG: hypothetical protein QNJ74_14265 [Trichodesmium sp. MO_231.B1]|nr:hypothetical protein [Trichodesmium sp. MO_231.B1]
MNKQKPKDCFTTLNPELEKLIHEYARLASLPELNQQQAELLGEILEQASQSEIIGFWIAEVDHFLGHPLGLLKPQDRHSYEDQKARLREHFFEDQKAWLREHFVIEAKCLPTDELTHQDLKDEFPTRKGY